MNDLKDSKVAVDKKSKKKSKMERDSSYYDHSVKKFTELYGPDIGPWLAKRVASIHRRNSDPCKNNERICEVGNEEQEQQYQEQQNSGCCGSTDHDFHHFKSGRKFKYGFNYGH